MKCNAAPYAQGEHGGYHPATSPRSSSRDQGLSFRSSAGFPILPLPLQLGPTVSRRVPRDSGDIVPTGGRSIPSSSPGNGFSLASGQSDFEFRRRWSRPGPDARRCVQPPCARRQPPCGRRQSPFVHRQSPCGRRQPLRARSRCHREVVPPWPEVEHPRRRRRTERHRQSLPPRPAHPPPLRQRRAGAEAGSSTLRSLHPPDPSFRVSRRACKPRNHPRPGHARCISQRALYLSRTTESMAAGRFPCTPGCRLGVGGGCALDGYSAACPSSPRRRRVR